MAFFVPVYPAYGLLYYQKRYIDMDTNLDKIDAFFTAYANRFNDFLSEGRLDIAETANTFAPCFVEASPLGVQCMSNDDNFRQLLPKGCDFYKSIGTRSMRITSRQITALDDYHAMAKINWESIYMKEDGLIELRFDVHYFVQLLHGTIKIFAYITGDEQKLLQENGLAGAA